MKKTILVTGILLLVQSVYSQTPPFSTLGGFTSDDFWSRSANLQGTGSNLFGTRWNSPIYTVTGGASAAEYRMKLNAIFNSSTSQYSINTLGWAQGVNTTGYLLLGRDNNSITSGTSIYAAKGAFSLLHLNGEGSAFQEFGYRSWMKTGITMTGNQDLSYFGMRKLSTTPTEEDRTETTITWADNSTSLFGPDDFCFRFTGIDGIGSLTTVSSNFETDNDLDGVHIARFTARGLMGLGNTFGLDATGMAPGYARPASLLHLSHTYNDLYPEWGYLQITYRDITGEAAEDGWRMGIDEYGGQFNGYLRWQEETPLIVQTDWDNTPGLIMSGERMRISSTGAPGVTPPFPGIPNTTRVSVNYDGNSPIDDPRALLHLGKNVGGLAAYDAFMDYGTLVSNSKTSVFIGITPQGHTTLDGPLPVIGFANSDMIFANADGTQAEAARFDVQTNYLGVGNFSTTSGLAVPPSERIDVDGNGRFRAIPFQGGQSLILGLQAGSTANDVELSQLLFPGTPTQVLLGDGTWGSAASGTGFLPCADMTGAANLTADSKINLSNHNLYFENNDVLGQNHVGIGFACGAILRAKLTVQQIHPASISTNSIGIAGDNLDVASTANHIYTGVVGRSAGIQTMQKTTNRGGHFVAMNADITKGIVADIPASTQSTGSATGGEFNVAANSYQNTGVRAIAANSPVENVGGDFAATSTDPNAQNTGVRGFANPSDDLSVGGYFSSLSLGTGTSIGVMGEAGLTVASTVYPSNIMIGVYGNSAELNEAGITGYAGYFDGDVFLNGINTGVGYATISDRQFKKDIVTIKDAEIILKKLRPTTYFFDEANAHGMNFSEKKQYGLIAQEVEEVLPDIVVSQTKPAMVDREGKIITEELSYKAVNYDAMIPILIKGHQEQSSEIDRLLSEVKSKDSVIDDLNVRLTQLENCLSGILPYLCTMSQSSVQSTPEELKEQLQNALNVNLSDRNVIILDQNVPNPFAESTVITFSIPATVQRAQIHFYTAAGQLIQSVDIIERGNGRLNIFGADLSTGIYTYTLVADGQVVATKKMLKD